MAVDEENALTKRGLATKSAAGQRKDAWTDRLSDDQDQREKIRQGEVFEVFCLVLSQRKPSSAHAIKIQHESPTRVMQGMHLTKPADAGMARESNHPGLSSSLLLEELGEDGIACPFQKRCSRSGPARQ